MKEVRIAGVEAVFIMAKANQQQRIKQSLCKHEAFEVIGDMASLIQQIRCIDCGLICEIDIGDLSQ